MKIENGVYRVGGSAPEGSKGHISQLPEESISAVKKLFGNEVFTHVDITNLSHTEIQVCRVNLEKKKAIKCKVLKNDEQ